MSDHQQLVVDALARSDHAMNVAEISQVRKIAPRSVARTISELAEPLARLSFQLKDLRGEPLPLIIDVLKSWYSSHELTGMQALSPVAEQYVATAIASLAGDETTFISRTLSGLPASKVPAVRLLGRIDDALADLQNGDASAFLALPTPIRNVINSQVEREPDTDSALNRLRFTVHGLSLDEMGSTTDSIHSVISLSLRASTSFTTILNWLSGWAVKSTAQIWASMMWRGRLFTYWPCFKLGSCFRAGFSRRNGVLYESGALVWLKFDL